MVGSRRDIQTEFDESGGAVSYEEDKKFFTGLYFERHRGKRNDTLGLEAINGDFGIQLGFEGDWDRQD